MLPSRRFFVLFGLLAAAAAGVFFAAAIDHDFYAPGSRAFGNHLNVGVLSGHLPQNYERQLTPALILRKLYGIVAFTIVGFFAAALLDPNRRVVGCALLVAAFSACIEVAQKLGGSPEGPLSNAFDIACGAVGGVAGALFWIGWLRATASRKSR